MVPPRKDSVKVADVFVPLHLITTRKSIVERHDDDLVDQHGHDGAADIPLRAQKSKSTTFEADGHSPTAVRFRNASIAANMHDTPADHVTFATPKATDTMGSPMSLGGAFESLSDLHSKARDSVSVTSKLSHETNDSDRELPLDRQDTRPSNNRPNSMARRSRLMSVAQWARRGTIADLYEKAKIRGAALERKRWVQILFEYSIYVILLCIVYFAFIGMPLWKGSVWWLFFVVKTKFVVSYGWSITIGIAFLYAFCPLLVLFENAPEAQKDQEDEAARVSNTALLIPCYKSEGVIGATLQSALKVFPAANIFVIANGNSEVPLDNTEEVCRKYGVCHVWSSVGSKIVAQYVGCHKAKRFQNVLLIDDDCALPPNFPIVSDRLKGKVKSIGYTIKSVGPNSGKGTWCQQAQDLEYKLSGLQRLFAGKIGSATFPHGAISLWERDFLLKTFDDHPGYSVSEDWFFGDSCRRLGGRIVMCSSVFVETETPDSVFFSTGSRGGFGEMTIFKQRFMRWNFFFVNGLYYNTKYIVRSWSLGWWELGAKLFVFQEVYETLLYLFTPFILPMSLIVRPEFCSILLAATVAMYMINVIIFNEVHLRLKKERISWTVLLVYYMPYKLVLSFINVASCYWSLFKYAKYFAKRHPKIIEDSRAVSVAMHVRNQEYQNRRSTLAPVQSATSGPGGGRDGNGGSPMSSPYTTHGFAQTKNNTTTVTSAAAMANPRKISFATNIFDNLPPSPRRMQPTYPRNHTEGVQVTDFV